MKFRWLLFVPLSFLAPTFAEEIVFCNGRWTNQPCNNAQASIPAQKRVLSPAEARARSEKESLLHRLTMKSIEARRSFGVELDLSGVRSLCSAQAPSIEECRKEVERLDDRLEQRLKAARKAKEEEEERKRIKGNDNQTTVVVGQPIPFIVDPDPPYYRGGVGRVPWIPERTRSGARITPPTSPTASPWR